MPMKIFLSYASEQRELAKEIALALGAENHTVFFDRSALAPGEAYNAQIREAIEACQLFVFLISSHAVAAGRYTLTELEFAEHKWPKPWGYVLSVMALATAKADIPPYLRAGTMLQPAGNIAATVAAEVHRMPGPGWRRLLRRHSARLLVLLLLAVLAAGAAWWGYERYRQIRLERAALTRLFPEAARIQLGKLSLPYQPGAFVDSAEKGDLTAVTLFLAAGMDPNATTGSSPNGTYDKGQTALMAAASKGHTKVVAALVEAGADVNKTNSAFTPLNLAAAAGHLEVLRILLNKKIDIKEINRAFVDAAGSRRSEVLRVLLDRGADVRKAGPSAMVFLLHRDGGSVNREGEGDAEVSEILKTVLDLGADPNGKDQHGWSPLLAAAHGGFPTAIRLLLERGADVNVKCDCPNTGYGGATALMMAVRKQAPKSVEVLLGKGADVNQRDERGETALKLARSNGGGDENARRIDQLLSKSTTPSQDPVP